MIWKVNYGRPLGWIKESNKPKEKTITEGNYGNRPLWRKRMSERRESRSGIKLEETILARPVVTDQQLAGSSLSPHHVMFSQIFFLQKRKDTHWEQEYDLKHAVAMWCQLPARRAFSKSSIWFNRHGKFPRKYNSALSYLDVLGKRDTLCKFWHAFAIVIQLFRPVV